MDSGMLYGDTVNEAVTACSVLVPVRAPLSVALTAMLDVKTKVSPIIAGVRLRNSVIVGDIVFGAIFTIFDTSVNESPVLPVPVTVTCA